MFIYKKKTKARLNANMQEGIFTMNKNLFRSTYKTGPTRRHTHNMKRNPESLLDPCSRGERQAGGQSSVVYLTVGGRACSTMRHLTKVVGPVARRDSWFVAELG